jgi:catechol 2,3-dioxygenase-like lactoylglutathione lyase family enzyme
MSNRGFSDIGFATLALDKTREFYEAVLGFKPMVCDTITIEEGGKIRHIFFNTGRDQRIAFMEARDVPGVPSEYDAGINLGLGLPGGIYHFAFEAGNEAALAQKREELLSKRKSVLYRGDRAGAVRRGRAVAQRNCEGGAIAVAVAFAADGAGDTRGDNRPAAGRAQAITANARGDRAGVVARTADAGRVISG